MQYDHIFNELDIRTDPFALCELLGTCDLGLGRGSTATLHYILAGEGQIMVQDEKPLKVARGSLVLIPALQSHTLRSFGQAFEPTPECRPAELNLAHHLAKADQSTDGKLIALCAHVSVGLRDIQDVIDLIRVPLIECVSAQSELHPTIQRLLTEVSSPRLGSRAMIRALLLECVIDMLRRRLTAEDDALHWMAALRDHSIWNALRFMLDNPGQPHSVESLAETVGMSRSAFAKRFSDAYGSGPMDLLRDLRMRMAGSLLIESDLPVKRIAERVGFSSRSAFSRMFEAKTGQSPRAFRISNRTP